MAQIIAPLKNVKLVILALVANFILVPLLAVVITLIIPLDEPIRIVNQTLAKAPNLREGFRGKGWRTLCI
jgi:ACR3 family arsenite efflux pump ArsB